MSPIILWNIFLIAKWWCHLVCTFRGMIFQPPMWTGCTSSPSKPFSVAIEFGPAAIFRTSRFNWPFRERWMDSTILKNQVHLILHFQPNSTQTKNQMKSNHSIRFYWSSYVFVLVLWVIKDRPKWKKCHKNKWVERLWCGTHTVTQQQNACVRIEWHIK